jgi:hypothetical protein
MKEVRCETCRYWERRGDVGWCRRLPPHSQPGNITGWTYTTPDDWCGEHETDSAFAKYVISYE